ncbi:hypothetical protein DL764_004564 [Monosporascus ibericus]|uniref:Heterokaryon incompatibility domain-containing protein n=1 Tax=Monosporascus ibericus TaxID=155417 RepID=A0A4Q4TC72_9PEZI|nr:hypothetical protein DL764_004564 [Monosporascus ibericus]
MGSTARYHTDPERGPRAAGDAGLRVGAATPALRAQGTPVVDRLDLHQPAVSTRRQPPSAADEQDLQACSGHSEPQRRVRPAIPTSGPYRADRRCRSGREAVGIGCWDENDCREGICASKWFQRIWTMQESFLAEMAVFLVSDATCDAPLLYTYFVIDEALLPGGIHDECCFHERGEVYGVLSLLGAVWEDVVTPEAGYSKTIPEVYNGFASGMIMNNDDPVASGDYQRPQQEIRRPAILGRGLEGLRSETELYLPESFASPAQFLVMSYKLATIYLVYSRVPSLAALSDEAYQLAAVHDGYRLWRPSASL